MRFDRRVTLFAVLAVVCFALGPFADEKYDHVPVIVGTTYVVLSLLFLVDWLLRSRGAAPRRTSRGGAEPEE